jgi:hypothetical protein
MRPRASGAASGGPWARYVPDSQAPWDLRRVVHLHRRAGFAATWAEIQRDLNDGPEASAAFDTDALAALLLDHPATRPIAGPATGPPTFKSASARIRE